MTVSLPTDSGDLRHAMRDKKRDSVSWDYRLEEGRPLAVSVLRNETPILHRLRHLRRNLHRAGLVGRLHGETSSACAVPVAGSPTATHRSEERCPSPSHAVRPPPCNAASRPSPASWSPSPPIRPDPAGKHPVTATTSRASTNESTNRTSRAS